MVCDDTISITLIMNGIMSHTFTAGEDYVAFVGDLTFSPTSESVQCVDITINEDSNLEAVEFLDVVISSGGADIATGQIIIQNVGSKCYKNVTLPAKNIQVL